MRYLLIRSDLSWNNGAKHLLRCHLVIFTRPNVKKMLTACRPRDGSQIYTLLLFKMISVHRHVTRQKCRCGHVAWDANSLDGARWLTLCVLWLMTYGHVTAKDNGIIKGCVCKPVNIRTLTSVLCVLKLRTLWVVGCTNSCRWVWQCSVEPEITPTPTVVMFLHINMIPPHFLFHSYMQFEAIFKILNCVIFSQQNKLRLKMCWSWSWSNKA